MSFKDFHELAIILQKKTARADALQVAREKPVEVAVKQAEQFLSLEQFFKGMNLIARLQASAYIILFVLDKENPERIRLWTYIEKDTEKDRILIANGRGSEESVLFLSSFCISKMVQMASVSYVEGSIFEDDGHELVKGKLLEEKEFISFIVHEYAQASECLTVIDGNFTSQAETM